MNINQLSKLTKEQLIQLLLNKQTHTPTPAPRTKRRNWSKKPIPHPRKTVKQMVQDYENKIIAPPIQLQDDIIIPPPIEFQDNPKLIAAPRRIKPVPLPRTQIRETAKAFQGYTKSFEVGIKNEKDPLMQLNTTAISYCTSFGKTIATNETIKIC